MENKITRRLFEEMIERKKKVAEAEKFILQEETKFNETVSGAKELVKTNNEEIMKIYETQIKVGAESLLEEIAKELNVNVDNLFVNVEFLDTARFGNIGRNKFLKLVENESYNGSIKCVLTVECKTKGVDETMRLVLPLNLLHYQKDGKRLKQFLEVETEWRSSWSLYTDFKCPDYRNLIFEFNYSALIEILSNEYKPRDKKCEMILNAYERECEKEKQSLPLHDRFKYIQS